MNYLYAFKLLYVPHKDKNDHAVYVKIKLVKSDDPVDLEEAHNLIQLEDKESILSISTVNFNRDLKFNDYPVVSIE